MFICGMILLHAGTSKSWFESCPVTTDLTVTGIIHETMLNLFINSQIHWIIFSLLQLYYQALNFGMIVSSALMIWKGLMVVTGSESPIVVVLR